MIQIQFLIIFKYVSLETFMLVFLKKRTKSIQNSKARLTAGIKISCGNKGKLYLLCRESNDAELKICYKYY